MKLLYSILIIAFCCTIPVLVSGQSPQQTNISEVRHFPNPAGSAGAIISISFTLTNTSFVNIKVLDKFGRMFFYEQYKYMQITLEIDMENQ